MPMSDQLEYLTAYVPVALVEQAAGRIRAACAAQAMVVEMQRNNGDLHFVIQVPQAQAAALEAALKGIAGAAVGGAAREDVQQFHQIQEGTASAQLDF